MAGEYTVVVEPSFRSDEIRISIAAIYIEFISL
jgi:hypothetical protein